MPLISIKTIKGVFLESQKTEIIKRVTEAVVAVEGESLRPLIWVLFEEVPEGSWAMGGLEIEAEHVAAVRNGSIKLSDALRIV